MREAIASGEFQPAKILRIAVSTQHRTASEKEYWHQDEISIEGKMYDVVCTKETTDSLLIDCLSDDDETDLANAFIKTFHSNRGSLPNSKISSITGFFLPFILADTFVLQKRIIVTNWEHSSPAQFQIICADAEGVPTPPPRQA